MGFSTQEVLGLAELARLELSAEEVEVAGRELESILSYVDRLQRIDTAGVEPMTMPAKATGWREDVSFACDDVSRELILQNFPARKGDLLCTPGVFEKPKGGR